MKTLELALLMQRIGAAIEKLNPKDVQLLLANKASVNIVVTPIATSVESAAKKSVIDHVDIEAIASKLGRSVSREQGTEVLRSLNRAQLQALAKHISVSVDSGATKDKLIEKVVERCVGLRLRQDAFAQAMNTG